MEGSGMIQINPIARPPALRCARREEGRYACVPARFSRGGEELSAVVPLRPLPEPQVAQPLLVEDLEDEEEEGGHDPDGEADEDEHDVAHVEGRRLADAELLVHVELDVVRTVESPVEEEMTISNLPSLFAIDTTM